MRAGQIIGHAFKLFAGTAGEMALALETKKPVKRGQVLAWQSALRSAADALEPLAKGTQP